MKKMRKLVDMEKKLIMLMLLLQLLSLNSLSLGQSPSKPTANITVMGLVYCDVCSNNSFSKHSYFIPDLTQLRREQENGEADRVEEQRSLRYVYCRRRKDGNGAENELAERRKLPFHPEGLSLGVSINYKELVETAV